MMLPLLPFRDGAVFISRYIIALLKVAIIVDATVCMFSVNLLELEVLCHGLRICRT